MFSAYRCIEEWFAQFEHRTTHEATRIYGYLFDRVKVLWYEAPEDVDSTDLFTRLNVGRIPLTDAELVKALLLSRGQAGEGQTDRALEMAAHWDGIERDLRSPRGLGVRDRRSEGGGDPHQPPARHARRRIPRA